MDLPGYDFWKTTPPECERDWCHVCREFIVDDWCGCGDPDARADNEDGDRYDTLDEAEMSR